MAIVAQLVRALVCGAGGRGFEPHRPPLMLKAFQEIERLFCVKYVHVRAFYELRIFELKILL